jgi:hypothetical protein
MADLTQDELDHVATREALSNAAGVHLVGRLTGLQSIHRNLRYEDRVVAVNEHASASVHFGKNPALAYAEAEKAIPALPSEDAEDKAMGDILAGAGVTINNFYGQQTGDGTAVAGSATSPADASPVAAPLTAVAKPELPVSTAPDVTKQLDQLHAQLKVIVNKPTTTVPTWMKTAILATAIGSPLTAVAASYLLRPSAPRPYGFKVIEGISQETK